MKRHLVAAIVLAWALSLAACAEDAPVAPALPAAVGQTVKANFPAAQIVKVQELRIGAKADIWYNVRLSEGERRSDVTVMSDGVLREARAHLLPADLPKPVAEALAANSDGGKAQSILRTTTYVNERGKLDPPQVRYVAVLAKDNLLGTLVLAADGALLYPLTWKAKQSLPAVK